MVSNPLLVGKQLEIQLQFYVAGHGSQNQLSADTIVGRDIFKKILEKYYELGIPQASKHR